MKPTKFNQLWLKEDNFKKWLEFNEKDENSAKCKLCQSTFSLSNMGKQALSSHVRSKKHQQNTAAANSSSSVLTAWASKPTQPSVPTNLDNPTPLNNTIDSYVMKEDVLKAEIYWTMNEVTKHHSYNSGKNTSALFGVMFPDSTIAQKFACGPSKTSYLAAFGLAPYFEKNLLDQLREVPFYSVSFDESFNKVTKNEQLDFSVRYWDPNHNQVIDRYFGSEFLGHARAVDLLESFKSGTNKLIPEKLIQVSMDGPNVNLKFLRDLKTDRSIVNPEIPSLIDIGTCGLHVIHGAFRSGFESTGWKIDSLLKLMFYLFNESPARRSDYTQISGSTKFPLQFCGTRWIEDSRVAERAVSIWEHITKYIEETSKGPQSKIPKCSSFVTVQKVVNEPTTIARLHVFNNVAKSMQPFLEKFQNEEPMVPFIEQEQGNILRSVMDNFIKKEVLLEHKYMSALLNIDVAHP